MKKIIGIVSFSLFISLTGNVTADPLPLPVTDPTTRPGDIVRVYNDMDLVTYCDFGRTIIKSIFSTYYFCVKAQPKPAANGS